MVRTPSATLSGLRAFRATDSIAMTGIEPALIAGAVLVLLGVLASKVSSRLGVPALVLFIAVGMLAGSDGPGGIDFTDFELVQNLGIVALAYILFEGGLSSSWTRMRRLLAPGLGLATTGVAITAAATGAVAAVVLDLPWTTGLLLGAIVSSTDAAAVFAVLGARSAALRGEVTPVLELESGSNDPMAVFLTIGLIELIVEPSTSVASLVPFFFQQMTIGAALGLAFGWLAVQAVNRLLLEHDGLYPVLSLAMVMLTYGVTARLGGSGFLAVYLAGMVLGNADLLHRRTIDRVHAAVAWLCQIGMFLVLGLLVFPTRLDDVVGPGLLIAAALVLLARPIAVMVTLALSRFDLRERTMISWVGLRGAVPIILATFPLVAGVPDAQLIFDVVFFVVLVSVLIQGTTIAPIARLLGVAAPAIPQRRAPLEAADGPRGATQLHQLTLGARAPSLGRSLVELRLPTGSLVVLIERDGEYVVPEGGTQLRLGDTVMVLAESAQLDEVRSKLVTPRD